MESWKLAQKLWNKGKRPDLTKYKMDHKYNFREKIDIGGSSNGGKPVFQKATEQFIINFIKAVFDEEMDDIING